MSKSKQIIESLQSGDLYGAQKLINEALMIKMGEALEEKLVNFAPSVFNEAKKAKKDYDGDGKVESSSAEFLGSRDKAIKKSMAMKEEWTEQIPNGSALANALSTYQNTGQMPPELVDFYQQNPPVGTGKKKKPVVGQSQTINAGYEPDEDLNSLVESFENDIREIVQEIQEQTGEALSDQEIEDIANQYLSIIGEMTEEEYEDDEEDEEDQVEGNEDY